MSRSDRRRAKRNGKSNANVRSVNPPEFVNGKDSALRVVGTVTCLCGVPTDVAERVSDNEPCLLHPMPPCKFFLENEPDVILRNIRSRAEGSS